MPAERIAAMLGHEAALFMATARRKQPVRADGHCGRGDEYLVGQMAHTYRYEGGGGRCWAASSRSRCRSSPTARWRWDIEAAIKPDDPHRAQPPAVPGETI